MSFGFERAWLKYELEPFLDRDHDEARCDFGLRKWWLRAELIRILIAGEVSVPSTQCLTQFTEFRHDQHGRTLHRRVSPR